MSSQVLGDKDVNAPMVDPQQQQQQQQGDGAPIKDVKSMEYHRQVFHNKMTQEKYVPPPALSPFLPLLPGYSLPLALSMARAERTLTRQTSPRSDKYVSPSDNIMSPCTAKINEIGRAHV